MSTFPKSYHNIVWVEAVGIYANKILQRSIDDVTKQLIQLIRNELAWDLVTSLLYNPICVNESTTCPLLMRGTLTRGMQVSLVEFLYQSIYIMRQMIFPGYPQSRLTLIRKTSELMLAYEEYVRPKLLNIQVTSLEVLKARLQESQNWLMLVLWKVCLPVFVGLMALITLQAVRR